MAVRATIRNRRRSEQPGDGVVQKRPFLGYRCRAETAGPWWLDVASKAVL
jgi:hypothetical protein